MAAVSAQVRFASYGHGASSRMAMTKATRLPQGHHWFPKSNIKLNSRDYCLIGREDGGVVPFVFIRAVPRHRSAFYGGICDVVLDHPTSDMPAPLRLHAWAMVGVECFIKNGTPVVGNLMACLDAKQFAHVYEDVVAGYVGHKSSVWGYRTILKYANLVPRRTAA